VIGDDVQGVEITLDEGESVRAEAGAMAYMTPNVTMTAEASGGILKGISRALSGESFFLTVFTCTRGRGTVCFAAPVIGKIIALDLAESGPMLVQRGGYLCAARGVEIEVAFTKRLSAGLFGGEGFVLQRLVGDGLAFVHACGAIERKTLEDGEEMRVDTGCIVAMQEAVGYEIRRAGSLKTSLFGGEGLFLASLRGPGEVYLQTLPIGRLASHLRSFMPQTRGS
jgi:uncharacterized protein (TIGR00266 family)